MTDVKRGPGRPKGAKSKHTKELAEQVAATATAIESIIPGAFTGDAHALLMALYKDPRKEITISMRAPSIHGLSERFPSRRMTPWQLKSIIL